MTHSISAAVDLPWPHKHLSPNARVHWRVKHRAVSIARRIAYYAACDAKKAPGFFSPFAPDELLRVTTTFYPPDRRQRDEDNLKASCKAFYDGISDAIGVDDKHFRHAPVIIAEPVKGGNVRIVLEPA